MSGESEPQGLGPIHDAFTIQNLEKIEKIENARTLFQHYAPPMFAQKALWTTLQIRPGHFVDARLDHLRTEAELSRAMRLASISVS